MGLVVVSTGLNAPAKARCLESVASQKGVPFRHVYIEAANIPAHLRAVLRPFRLAWLEAEDIDTEAVAAEKPNGEPTAALQREQ